MKEKLEKVKELMARDWTLSEKYLLLADVLLAGILLGWLTSPFKRGFHFFSGNTIGSGNGFREDDCDGAIEFEIEDEEEEEEEA